MRSASARSRKPKRVRRSRCEEEGFVHSILVVSALTRQGQRDVPVAILLRRLPDHKNRSVMVHWGRALRRGMPASPRLPCAGLAQDQLPMFLSQYDHGVKPPSATAVWGLLLARCLFAARTLGRIMMKEMMRLRASG